MAIECTATGGKIWARIGFAGAFRERETVSSQSKSCGRASAEASEEPLTSPASGIFTWIVPLDTLYGDGLVAECFGFGSDEAKAGMPVGQYLSRIHPDDVERVTNAMRETIATGLPFQESYRVCRPDGSELEVAAYAACFRNSDDEPTHYSGIVCPLAASDPAEGMILRQLILAYDIAVREGKEVVAAKIAAAMAEIVASHDDPPQDAGEASLH